MAQDLYLLKSFFENNHQISHYKTFKTLVQVFEQQCVIKQKKSPLHLTMSLSPGKESIEIQGDITTAEPEIEIREKPEVDKIISSPDNTDAK